MSGGSRFMWWAWVVVIASSLIGTASDIKAGQVSRFHIWCLGFMAGCFVEALLIVAMNWRDRSRRHVHHWRPDAVWLYGACRDCGEPATAPRQEQR